MFVLNASQEGTEGRLLLVEVPCIPTWNIAASDGDHDTVVRTHCRV